MNKGSPVRIKYYSYKVEFALRGAAHIHGVLWMDWDNFSALKSENDEHLKTKLKSLVKAFDKIKENLNLSTPDKDVLAEFADLSITCSLKDYKTKNIVEEVQIHNHTKACKKYSTNCRFSFPRFPSLRTIIAVPYTKMPGDQQEQKQMLEKSKSVLKKVFDTLNDEVLLKTLVNEDQGLIDKYIRLQQAIYMVEKALEEIGRSKNLIVELCPETITMLNEFCGYSETTNTIFIDDLNIIHEQLNKSKESFNVKNIERRRLEKLLAVAGVEGYNDKTALQVYEDALGISSYGYKVVHRRDIDECYVNNYNAEWIISWNSNMDLQLSLCYHSVITYVSDYFSKDDSGTMPHILEALKRLGNESLQSSMAIVANMFLTHRQIGESEAFYKILPHLQMKHSNIDAVFLPTGFK